MNKTQKEVILRKIKFELDIFLQEKPSPPIKLKPLRSITLAKNWQTAVIKFAFIRRFVMKLCK